MVGAPDGIDHYAVLEDEERWHRRNTVCLRNALLSIDVHFHKYHAPRLTLCSGEMGEDGSNGFAGAAPVRVEVSDNVGRRGEEGGEMARAGDGYDGHGGCKGMARGCLS